MEENDMELTAYQEEQLMQQYDRLLWSIVHRFKRKMHDGYDNKEDLHSECVLVFLKHIRSCQTMEEIQKVPVLNMINAMCLFVLGEQTLSYPKRTSNFSEVIKTAAGKADYTELDKNETMRYDPINDTLDTVAFREFFSELSPADQQIVILKLKGCRNCTLATKLGVSNVAMTRAIKKLRKFYQDCAA